MRYIGIIIQEKDGSDRAQVSIPTPRVAPRLNIFELEIGAARMGAHLHGPGTATLATDNLASYHALRKGHSHSDYTKDFDSLLPSEWYRT